MTTVSSRSVTVISTRCPRSSRGSSGTGPRARPSRPESPPRPPPPRPIRPKPPPPPPPRRNPARRPSPAFATFSTIQEPVKSGCDGSAARRRAAHTRPTKQSAQAVRISLFDVTIVLLDDAQIYATIGEDGFERLVGLFYRQVPTDDI